MPDDQATYLFIDGAYLRRIFENELHPFVREPIGVDWMRLKTEFSATRAFFYDCIDEDRRAGESDREFELRIDRQRAAIDAMNAVPGYFARLGSLRGEGKRRRQKEVDVLLAVDMMTHSHNRNMSRAVLLAGDLDFKPVVEALIQQGTVVTVSGSKKSSSRPLAYSADQYRPLGLEDLWHLSLGHLHPNASRLFPYRCGLREPPRGQRLRVGVLSHSPLETIELYRESDTWMLVRGMGETAFASCWSFHDIDRLLECVEASIGRITWSD